MIRFSWLVADLARFGRRRQRPAPACVLVLITLAAAVIVLTCLSCWLVTLLVVVKSW